MNTLNALQNALDVINDLDVGSLSAQEHDMLEQLSFMAQIALQEHNIVCREFCDEHGDVVLS